MAANKDVQDFYELRAGLQGMFDFAEAALEWMDDQGLAMPRKKTRLNGSGGGTNGTGPSVETLREAARERFMARAGKKKGGRGGARKRKRGGPTDVQEPDGKHVTTKEAAKILKMSDANIRIMTKDGRLPKPTYEYRPWSRDQPDRKKAVQVILLDDVKAYVVAQKAAAKAEKK